MKYDVVVVGAGPAGSIAAKYAVLNGASTLIIEEHPFIGSPVQCTGIISTEAYEECEADCEILNKIRGAFVYSPSCQELYIKGKDVKAYVIDRKMFDRHLAVKAIDQGADILLKTKAVGLCNRGKNIVLKTQSNGSFLDIETGVVIGADGVQSSIARLAGLAPPKEILSGIQFEGIYDAKDPGFAEIFIGRDIAPGFFAWAVPVNEKISRIGLCIRTYGNENNIKAIDYLKKLMSEHPVVSRRYKGSLTEFVVGCIPVAMIERSVTAGVIILGDAAGQVKPTSGGGIYMGAKCARIAGTIAADCARKGDTGKEALMRYESEWHASVGKELKIGHKLHKSLGKLSDSELNTLIEFFKQPKVNQAITEYGDMDHPSVLLRKLISNRDSFKLLGIAFKTLFS